jgi:hypothetical protein
MGPLLDRIVVIITLGGLTGWVLWGWRAWMRKGALNLSLGVIFSLIGFSIATASAALEVGSGTYAQFRDGGFPFNDPTLLRIYFGGFWLALLGLACGLVGVGNKSPLRFKAPALSVVLLVLWMWQAMGE